MKWTNLFFNNNFFERDNKNFELIELMQKSCFVHQDTSGIYSWLSLGLILERKIESIIQDEMNNIGFSEIRLSIVQDADLWKKTNRFDTYGEELFKLKNRKDHEFCLSATCEELITNIVKNHYNGSNMNLNVYQIGNKYRDELRAKSGLIRAKEFIMKDGYSFCSNESNLNEIYLNVKSAYENIFKRLGIDYTIKSSENGEIGGKSSEEFHCFTDFGEDLINNKNSLEIAHIFNLGQEYSKKFGLTNGIKENIHMGCFGIGISRLLMALLEKQRDELGFFGTKNFNTFETVISVIDYKKEEHKKIALDIYNLLKNKKINVLLDDRDLQAGKKMCDSELIGVKNRIVVSKNSIINNSYEFLNRENMQKSFLTYEEIANI